MADVIEFPKPFRYHQNRSGMTDEEMATEIYQRQVAEAMAFDVVFLLINQLHNSGMVAIDSTNRDDIFLVHEAVKALVLKTYGIEHFLHAVTDRNAANNPAATPLRLTHLEQLIDDATNGAFLRVERTDDPRDDIRDSSQN